MTRWTLPPTRSRRRGSTWPRTCPSRSQPPLHPGTARAGRAGRPGAAVPDGADRAGDVSAEPWIDVPGEVLDILAAVAAHPAGPRGPAGEGARHARRGSTSRTSRSRPPGRTSRTPRCRRPSTTRPRGSRRLATETGAGQWGTALSFACAQFDLECKVYMVRASVPAEAVPPGDDGDVGRESVVARRPVDEPGPPRVAGRRDLRRGARTRRRAPTPTTRWARCSTTCCCTRP